MSPAFASPSFCKYIQIDPVSATFFSLLGTPVLYISEASVVAKCLVIAKILCHYHSAGIVLQKQGALLYKSVP